MKYNVRQVAGYSLLLWFGSACGEDGSRDAGHAEVDAGPPVDRDPPCSRRGEAQHDRVCVQDRWRTRCSSDETCGDGSCCFGLCIPRAAEQTFCESCPCEDDSTCAPRTAACDTHPFQGKPLPTDLFGQGPADQPWRTSPIAWPFGFGQCAPIDLCAAPAKGGSEVACSVENTDSGDRVFPACSGDGALESERRLEHVEGAPHAAQVTHQRDECGDVTVLASSRNELPEGPSSLYGVTVTRYANDVITSCQAQWNGARWDEQASSAMRKQADGTWSYGGAVFDDEGRLLSYTNDDTYAYGYDGTGRLKSISVTLPGDEDTYHQQYEYLYEENAITEHASGDFVDYAVRVLSLDAQGRPLSFSVDGSVAHEWKLDASGNLTSCGAFEYGYDAAACQAEAVSLGVQ